MAFPCTQILASLPSSLNIIGQDIYIMATDEIKTLVEQELEFEIKYFTPTERSATESGIRRIQYLAGRFCAKKAVLKSLKIEPDSHTSWLEIEVQRLPTGEPSVVLYGSCQKIAAELGIAKWLLSISHVSAYATASAIALGSSADAIALGSSAKAIALSPNSPGLS